MSVVETQFGRVERWEVVMTRDRANREHERTYSLDELTDQAGVTVRTVRYYIAEGLLPPAVGGGPRSAYTPGHLDRLRLIGRLKDAYLPLREIRHRVAGLSDQDVRAALARTDELAATGPVDSAADYIARVRHRDLNEITQPIMSPPRSSHHGRAPSGPDHALAEDAPPASAAALELAEPSTWRRLAITAEAELLIREETYQRRAEQIDGLIAWARRILG
ncbi:MAG: MerR family transcriptional regulator [Chloroflexia bacterium]|nr:MerR family transcriptional regulator [Chloroflexia bacterium]